MITEVFKIFAISFFFFFSFPISINYIVFFISSHVVNNILKHKYLVG